MATKKAAALKVVEDDTASSEELVDEVMAVLSAMTEDDRVAVFEEIANSYDLETGEELDEEDGGDESGPDGDPSDEDDEDEDVE